MTTEKLNRLSHIVFMLTCVVLVGLAGWRAVGERWLDGSGTATSSTSSPQPFAKGARLAAIDGVSYKRAPATLAMVVQSSCPYCAASMPFYRRLSDLRTKKRFQFVAASFEATSTTTRYLTTNGVEVDAIATLKPGEIPTSGTPTLVLVADDGTVLDSWLGQLSESQEGEVLARIDQAAAGG